eukprot:m.49199 g.49199  ORF g.49199 m.49199 type:complete len:389 (+) comp7084_c0_seq2:86-1252(+)
MAAATPPLDVEWLANHTTDLLSSGIGGKCLFATDQWFAAVDNLISPADPVWKEGVFTSQGKWMDGWESRRKRTAGHDWALFRLAVPGRIDAVDVDTAFFTGNFPPMISIEGATDVDEHEWLEEFRIDAGVCASPDMIAAAEATVASATWVPIVSRSPLQPGNPDTRHNVFRSESSTVFTHVRINYHPDGGVARVRVFGTPQPDFANMAAAARSAGVLSNLVALKNGGRVVAWNNMHYGHPRNILRTDHGLNMGDGWETARQPLRPPVLEVGPDGNIVNPGCDWCVIQLGATGKIKRLEVDTSFFKGNYPESFQVEACMSSWTGSTDVSTEELDKADWKVLFPRHQLGPDNVHHFTVEPDRVCLCTHLRLTIFPDGGIMRFKALGEPVV